MHSSQLVYTWNVFEKPFPWQTLRLLKILEWFKKPVWIIAVISYPNLTFFFSHFIRDHEIEHLKTYFYKDSLISEILPILYWKTIRFYILFCILHKINQLCPKMLRARRDRLRGKNIHERPFTSCYSLLSLTAPTFLLLEIKSQNCYLRKFFKIYGYTEANIPVRNNVHSSSLLA